MDIGVAMFPDEKSLVSQHSRIKMSKAKNTKTKNDHEHSTKTIDARQIIKKIMLFLQLFMCETLAKRILSIVLITVSVPNSRVTELTGLCDRSVRTLKRAIETGEIDSLFSVGGGGRKRKLINVEEAIIKEINNNNYHSQQQIADMIYEQYEIKVSQSVVARLLKKTVSNA